MMDAHHWDVFRPALKAVTTNRPSSSRYATGLDGDGRDDLSHRVGVGLQAEYQASRRF